MLTFKNIGESKRSTPLDVKKCQGSGRRSQNRKGEASGYKNKNQLRETGKGQQGRYKKAYVEIEGIADKMPQESE